VGGVPALVLAQLKGVIDGHAQDEVGGLQFLASDIEKLALLGRYPGEPVLTDGTSPLAYAFGARVSQGPTLRRGAEYTIGFGD
jgi:hypothetical protein